jgi:hypothetical protein
VPTPRLRRGPRDKRRETQQEDVHPEHVWIRPAVETPRRAWHDPVPLNWPNPLLSCGRAAVDTLGTTRLGAAHRAGQKRCRTLTGSSGRDGANAGRAESGVHRLAIPAGRPATASYRRRGPLIEKSVSPPWGPRRWSAMLFSVGFQTTTVLDTALVDQARAVPAHRPRLVTSNRSSPSRAGEVVGPRKVMVRPVVPDERPHDDRSAKDHICVRRRPKRCEPLHDGSHDERHA